MDKLTITCRSPSDCTVETAQTFTELTVNGQSLSRSTQCGLFEWPGHDYGFEYHCAGTFQGARKLELASDCRNPSAYFRPTTDVQRVVTQFMKGRPDATGREKNFNHLQLSQLLTDAGFYDEAAPLIGKITDKGLRAEAMAFWALRKNQPAFFDQSLVLAKNPAKPRDNWSLATVAHYMAQAGLFERAIGVVASASSVVPGKFENSFQYNLAGDVIRVAAQKAETHPHIMAVIGRLRSPKEKNLAFMHALHDMTRNGFFEEALAALTIYPGYRLDSYLGDLANDFADQKLYKRALLIADMIADPYEKVGAQVVVEIRAGTVAVAEALVETVPTEKRDHARHYLLIHELSKAGYWEVAEAQAAKLGGRWARDDSYGSIVRDMIAAGQFARGIPVAMRIQDPIHADGVFLDIAEAAAEVGGSAVAQAAVDKIESPQLKAAGFKFVEKAAQFSSKRPIPIDEAALEKDPSWVGLMIYCN